MTIDTDILGTGPGGLRAMGLGPKGKGKTSHVIAAPVTVQIDPAR